MGTAKLVLFRDVLEECADEHFGILFEDGCLFCLCCGGTIEEGDYAILEKYEAENWRTVDDMLKKHFK